MNLLGDEWSSENERPGFRWRRMRLAGERLGASLYELPPGERTWPYHYEAGNKKSYLSLSPGPQLSATRKVSASCSQATACCFLRDLRARIK
jgi:hypothetical protein